MRKCRRKLYSAGEILKRAQTGKMVYHMGYRDWVYILDDGTILDWTGRKYL